MGILPNETERPPCPRLKLCWKPERDPAAQLLSNLTRQSWRRCPASKKKTGGVRARLLSVSARSARAGGHDRRRSPVSSAGRGHGRTESVTISAQDQAVSPCRIENSQGTACWVGDLGRAPEIK